MTIKSIPKHPRHRTVKLEEEAADYLRVVCPRKTGVGAFLSRLVLEHKLRKELAAQFALTREAAAE